MNKTNINRLFTYHTAIVIITISIGAMWVILSERGAIYNVMLIPVIAGIIGTYKSIKLFHEMVDEE